MYRANVALNGNLGSVILKDGLTVPEIRVLIHVHGLGSVKEIAMSGKADVNSVDERERLNSIYSAAKVGQVFGNYGDLPMDIKELKLNKELFEKTFTPPINAPKKKKE